MHRWPQTPGRIKFEEVTEAMETAKSILKELTVPVIVLDESLRVVVANPAFHRTLKTVPEQVEGKPIRKFITETSTEPRLMEILEAVVAFDSSAEDIEFIYTTRSRTRKVLTCSARRLHIEENPTKMILLELRDITKVKESDQKIQELSLAQQQYRTHLENTNRELEAFTQSVSHDLRIPLRLMNKIVHLLLEAHRDELPPAALDKIQMILDGTREMGKLIEDLLAFSRVGRDPLKKRRIDMRRLAREVLAELKHTQEGRDVEVSVDELPPCRGDRALLKQVFMNLLANALKFTRHRERTEIHVGFTKTNGETVYFVRDNGVGFDMSDSGSIFLAFHRLNRKRDFEGSGIGLALVKRVIECHNGRIWAESEKDCGATFFFTLGE